MAGEPKILLDGASKNSEVMALQKLLMIEIIDVDDEHKPEF